MVGVASSQKSVPQSESSGEEGTSSLPMKYEENEEDLTCMWHGGSKM